MIVFARHGQTLLNRSGRLQGRLDAPLSELGLEQAAKLSSELATLPVTRIVASPLQRAVQTATAIAEPHGLEVETDDRIIELDYGEWDGIPLAAVPATAWDEWRADPAYTPPGGESLQAVTTRVAAFLDDALRDGITIAVSHVSPIKAAVCCALRVDERASWQMHLGVASVTRIGARPDGSPYLVSFNEFA